MKITNLFMWLVISVSVTLGNQIAFAQNDFWEQTNGPYGGLVYAIAINSSDHIFAAAAYDDVTGTSTGSVFRSIDNGNSWEEINTGLSTTRVFSLAVNTDDYIFAGTRGGGVFRSVEPTVLSADENAGSVVLRYSLSQNYPNPFNPVTTLRYDLPQRSGVTLTIYDILGREVTTLVQGVEEPGYKSVMWDGTDDSGRAVSTGVYLYQIRTGDYTQTRKMILLQ